MSLAAARHGQLTQALHGALANGEITVAYQPIVDLHSGDTLGVEALARWDSPVWGHVSPAEFIPIAEDSGAIHQLGHLVLDTSCRDIAALNAAGPAALEPLSVAVNISWVQIRRGGELVRDVEAALWNSGLPRC
jgi:EAL domain-containing protein (putative c-di-GMP-specific phosphodiesterase class I)